MQFRCDDVAPDSLAMVPDECDFDAHSKKAQIEIVQHLNENVREFIQKESCNMNAEDLNPVIKNIHNQNSAFHSINDLLNTYKS